MARNVKSTVKLNMPRIKQLTRAATAALEHTAEAIHTDVVQSQVIPYGDDVVKETKVYGKRGQFAKNGREYKGKTKRELVRQGGTLSGVGTFVDKSDSNAGKVRLVSSTPYARRLYYHPEYHFNKEHNPNAKGRWLDDYMKGGKKQDFAPKAYGKFYKKNAGL